MFYPLARGGQCANAAGWAQKRLVMDGKLPRNGGGDLRGGETRGEDVGGRHKHGGMANER